jgi:predicted phosphodiesterase
MKIAVVGDLSGGDPNRLTAVLDHALVAADIVCQVGDLEPAYKQVQSRVLTSGHKLFPVPGNHDTDYATLGVPRCWRQATSDGLTTLIGIDNSAATVPADSKALFDTAKATKFEFVFAHMAPAPLVLPDGSVNGHTMTESINPNPDADWLVNTLKGRADAMFVGHYHGFTVQFAPWGPIIVDGRGGAAPELAYTLITTTPDGWVLHSVGL